MEVFEIIRTGILSDEISLFVFWILILIFAVDIFLYLMIWINLLYLNWQVQKGSIYRMPLKKIIQGFEELLTVSINELNTRAYIEDFFSAYKAILFPLPLLSSLRVPIISSIKFIKNTVSLFILVGVLGTFVGIYTSLVGVLNPDIPGAILPGLESIAPVLSGMGTAFATSIIGMTLALLTTFLLKLFNAEQFLAGIMARLENYLDNEIKINRKSFITRQLQKMEQLLENGFNRMGRQAEGIHDSLKGFKAFSKQFEEAAAHMEHFNHDLAGSMDDLKDFYVTNKEFTEGFSKDVKVFGERFTSLFKSIDNLTSQQAELRKFMEKSTKTQGENINILEENINILKRIDEQIAESRQALNETNSKLQKELAGDIKGLEELLKIITKTAGEQQEIAGGYRQMLATISSVREELSEGFESNTEVFKTTLEEIKKSYHSEMGKNVKVFAEHVSLSSKIINKGFDSLVNKFENLDLLLGKYLSGVAFNAADLEGAVSELNQVVGQVEEGIREHNQSIQSLSKLIQDELEINRELNQENSKEHEIKEYERKEGEGNAQSGEKSTEYSGE